ncbi:hypothetical protein [Phenylobacterium aquaticum]|uniref:hypothetical protein n=1 Tax=Phenylobacterium aquaticum TaxID=1763816 RepID=UPI001F5DEFBD|nr:hypothetical protein [Phenylobacterium aquaticum]MCI3133740.1 hypothetical protein [Phenylobacterium aquaticum]
MLFLMNDVVLELENPKFAPKAMSRRFDALTFNAVTRLGQELYAEEPLLHLTRPDRAKRLAALILAKAPAINAAQFIATRFGGAPAEVLVSYRQVDFETMAHLSLRQDEGELDTLHTDRQVWRRLAA